MRILLFVLAVLSGLLGILGILVAKTAVGEIQGMLFMLISAVLLSGAGVIEAVNRLRADVQQGQQQAQPPSA
jgi:hypothetical protein